MQFEALQVLRHCTVSQFLPGGGAAAAVPRKTRDLVVLPWREAEMVSASQSTHSPPRQTAAKWDRLWYPDGKEAVMIELTEEQRQQLESGKAVDISDPQTAQFYVILRKDVYERVRHLLYDDSEWAEEELRLHLARSAKDNGWEEAGMEDYDRYDEERRKRCP